MSALLVSGCKSPSLLFTGNVMTYLSHACHELLKSPLTVIFINKQHFFDCALLEAHLVKLSQQA